ncbi:MAG: hypothetical protein FJ265_10975 [Planctomycetes bacterium]|nr:hypothetical protein [Planctomycetota bacterium]
MKAWLGVLVLLIAVAIGWVCWPRQNEAPRPVPTDAPGNGPWAAREPVTAPSAAAEVPTERAPAPGPTIEARALFGRVTCFPRKPVANATVAFWAKPPSADSTDAPLAEATTNEAGEYRVPVQAGWPRDGVLVASAPYFRSMTLPQGEPGKPVDFVLRQCITFLGQVCEAGSGQPLTGATLASGAGDKVQTDPNGNYRLETTCDAGRTVLAAHLAGYSSQKQAVSVHDVGEPVRIDFAMPRTTKVRVQVVDADTRAPIANARTWRFLNDRDPARHPDGLLSVSLAPGDDFSIEVGADGYCRVRWAWKVDTLPEGTLHLPLVGAATISGTVTASDKSPLAHCSLSAYEGNRPYPRNEALEELCRRFGLPGTLSTHPFGLFTEADAQGRYRVDVLPSAEPYTVGVTSTGYVHVTSAPQHLATPGATARVDFVLVPAATIVGTTRCNGEPWRGSVFWLRPDGAFGGRVSTDEKGDYELENVPAGTVELVLRGDGSARIVQRAQLTVAPGVENRHDFLWQETLHTITGRVTTHSGEPLPGGRVVAFDPRPSGSMRMASTLADGTYRLEADPGGVYDVRVTHGAITPERPGVPADTASVDFVLPELGLLRLRLVDAATGQPVGSDETGSWNVGWRESAEDSFHVTQRSLDSTGLFQLKLPLGRVDVTFHLQEKGYAPRTVTDLPVTREPDPAPIPVEITRGVSVTLTVADAAGFAKARAGHVLFLLEQSQLGMVRGPFPRQGGPSNMRINGICVWLEQHGLMNQMPDFDDTGRARLTGLLPGRYRLVALPGDLTFTPADFAITADGTVVELAFRRQ